MIIENYGIRLKKIAEHDIENIRQWRNNPEISKYMEFRENITPKMQKIWYDKVNNENNYYFIVEKNEIECGLINIKDICFTSKTGEAGVFYLPEHTGTVLPFQALLILLDFAFEHLFLDIVIAHILSDNKRAIRYNERFGFKCLPNQPNVHNQEYRLSRSDYLKHKPPISNLIQKVSKS